MELLTVGTPAPDFTAAINGGGEVSLKSFRGSFVVLYFYPKDDTPGCTTEACGFRDAHFEYKKRGVVVLGVSKDSARKHDRFVEKHDLPFRLIADEDQKIVNAYQVWGEKKFMGRTYMGIHRVTYLIDPKGEIARVWSKVKPKDHAAEVLEALVELTGDG